MSMTCLLYFVEFCWHVNGFWRNFFFFFFFLVVVVQFPKTDEKMFTDYKRLDDVSSFENHDISYIFAVKTMICGYVIYLRQKKIINILTSLTNRFFHMTQLLIIYFSGSGQKCPFHAKFNQITYIFLILLILNRIGGVMVRVR